MDPALTASILQLINSSHFSLPNKVLNLDQALVLIGMDAVKNIALSTSVHQVFSENEDWKAFDLNRFWRHSLKCALLARAISKRIRYPNPEEAFLTGLIHDVGKLVLWVNFKKKYEKIIETAGDDTDLLLSEESKLGALHSEIGSWLVTQWHLPTLISDAIHYHHEPLYRILDAFALVRIIYVANVLSQSEDKMSNGIQAAESVMGLSREETISLVRAAEKDLLNAARYLDIDIESAEEEAQWEEQKKKSKLLTKEVSNASLLLGTLQNLVQATNDESLVRILYQSLKILFDIKQCLFFQYDYERDLLICKGSPRNFDGTQTSTLALPYNESKSILAKSIKDGVTMNSFESGSESILDEQIVRILGKGGIVCHPLLVSRSKVGVLVLGIEKESMPQLLQQQKRIGLLTNQIALALHTDNLRKIQRRQIQTERIEASSDTVKRIVHEANNPLSIIRNYLVLMEKKLGEESPVREETRIVSEEIDRVSHLLDELSEFSEPAGQEQEIDINSIISDQITLSKETLLADIRVKVGLDKSLPRLSANTDRMKQIILNLIKNAVEAMPGGGELSIETKLLKMFPLDEVPEISIDKREASGYIQIIITDTGAGIPETVRMHLFEPFVSTKKEGHQGIGLSIVYNAVKVLGGTITVRSRKGDGTRFNLFFPIKQKS
jgi:nitrogen-specific signal transduction histidine kinase/HD-like signal output (HDOD) protein